MKGAAEPVADSRARAPWRGRVAVLVAMAALVVGAVVLTAQPEGDDGPGATSAEPPEVAVPAPGDGPVVYLLGPNAFEEDVLGFDALVRQSADAAPRDVDARITAALQAAATPTDQQLAAGLRAPLSEGAVPTVTVDCDLAILDWDREGARSELGSWGTSSGSTGMNPIVGMVFDNAPDVQAIENRLDGSCEVFTEVMQGAGCQRDARSRWETYKGTLCAGRDVVSADVDADGRVDEVIHEWIEDGMGGGALLGVCTASGVVASVPGAAQAEWLRIIDIEPDGRAEIVFGGTTVSASISSVAVLIGDELVVVTSEDGAAFLVQDGGLAHDEQGPTAVAAVGCQDLAGDDAHELVLVTATFSDEGVLWTREGYVLTGGSARRVHVDSGSDPAPGDRLEFPATVTEPCTDMGGHAGT